MGVIPSKISTSKVAKQIKQDDPFYSWKHVRRYDLDLPTNPFCVTYPKTSKQVSQLVKIAAENGLKVQAKSGGHSYCSFSSPDGGMVIDLWYFQQFQIDPQAFVCDVGAVGIGGHATIGGLGPSSRKYGSALDHIESVKMVIADGRQVTASANENPDLYWAVRGAGVSFGVISEFKVKTEPGPENIIAYRYSFTSGSWRDMAAVLKPWQQFVNEEDLTEDFASEALWLKPNFPLHSTGAKTVALDSWLSSLTHGAQEVALLLGRGIPARAYTKTLTFSGNDCDRIPDEVVDEMFEYIENTSKGTLIWFIIFDLAGGAVNKVPMDATAFAHRDALFYPQAYAMSDKLSPVSSTTKAFLKGLTDLIVREMTIHDGHYHDYGAYPGYLDLEINQPQKAYWRSNLPRLEGIKAKYDPLDIFHNPQGVRPNGKDVSYELPAFAKGGEVPWWAKLFH